MNKDRKATHRKSYRNVHECMEALLSREDLKKIHLLGLWTAFDDLDQVKQFASRPRQERQEFFARYERSLDDAPRARPADADHQLFGLPQEAGEEEVRQRYRDLALTFHPDRNGGDQALMQEINAAYQRLLEAVARRRA
ncbi:MAG: J domain-containing protein [Candidatus Latescibacteria bacterium]|nr:J domain-containing protein [Candidatus Latescibacterota bacterium]